MSLLAARVAAIKVQLSAANLAVTGEKTIPYGQQLNVSNGTAKVAVNIYCGKKGITITIGGSAGPLKAQLEELVIGVPRQPSKPDANQVPCFEHIADFDNRWIGTDESGKGDVFGPLVIAGVMVDETTAIQLTELGIKDSKKISDVKITSLAGHIRELCKNRYVEMELMPERYNELYQSLSNQGQNLNHLLAWAHARVLEDLLAVAPCRYALADQFANERYIQAQLFAKGREITLVQAHRAERNIAVAAASVLARDRFLTGMQQLCTKFELVFPKGASSGVGEVIEQFILLYGKERLNAVGKVHFKTFEQIW